LENIILDSAPILVFVTLIVIEVNFCKLSAISIIIDFSSITLNLAELIRDFLVA